MSEAERPKSGHELIDPKMALRIEVKHRMEEKMKTAPIEEALGAQKSLMNLYEAVGGSW